MGKERTKKRTYTIFARDIQTKDDKRTRFSFFHPYEHLTQFDNIEKAISNSHEYFDNQRDLLHRIHKQRITESVFNPVIINYPYSTTTFFLTQILEKANEPHLIIFRALTHEEFADLESEDNQEIVSDFRIVKYRRLK